MSQATHYLNDAVQFFRISFQHANTILGLLIATYSVYQLPHWKKLWAVAFAAVLIHVIAQVLIPVIDHNAPLRLPPLVDLEFWREVAALYVGYVIVIAAFFFVKVNVLKPHTVQH